MARPMWFSCLMLLLAGCAPGSPGLVVAAVMAPNDTCVYDTSNAQLLAGTLDVGAANPRYVIAPLYLSQLLNLSQSGSRGLPRADPNLIQVQQAQVELRDVAGAPLALAGLPNPFTVPATGFVPSSDGSSAGEGIGLIQIIPPIYGEALRDVAVDTEIVVMVQAIGVTAGNATVTSPPFHFPIHVCSGCLFACVLDADGLGICRPTCTPGQDLLTTTPGACLSPPILSGCSAG